MSMLWPQGSVHKGLLGLYSKSFDYGASAEQLAVRKVPKEEKQMYPPKKQNGKAGA
jgi:hypothetical protein